MPDFEVNETGTRKVMSAKDMEIQELKDNARVLRQLLREALEALPTHSTENLVRKIRRTL